MEDNRHRREGDNHYGNREGRRPRTNHSNQGRTYFNNEDSHDRPRRSFSSQEGDRPRRSFNREDGDRPRRSFNREDGDRSRRNFHSNEEGEGRSRKSFNSRSGAKRFGGRPVPKGKKPSQPAFFKGQLAPAEEQELAPKKPTYASKGLVRLNKYIANAGVCSRRDADRLIEAGSVTVNGKVVTQMGYLVKEGDVVNYGGAVLRSEAKRYFLLNKPKGYITTLDDPQERQTVMELVASACKERIYPVGRLDRNTTGLLLFTNDGELAKKLTHPSTGVYKVYRVELDHAVTHDDMQKMLEGIELEDGMIKVDDVAYDINPADHHGIDKRIVGVQLHSGKNRIVRRIFESMGYTVHKLDRTVFAGLTKKDLPRGRYRELTDKELNFLKMI